MKTRAKQLATIVVFSISILVITACSTFSRTAFNIENTTSIAASVAAQEWVLYYKAATNDPVLFGTSLERLQQQRIKVDLAAHRVAVSLRTVENIRQQYVTNSSFQPSLQAALSTLTTTFAGPDGIISLVAEFVPTNWLTKAKLP